jgi:hypothetical protein
MSKDKFLTQVRNVIRLKHYSIRTEQTYIQWIRRFILFHHKRHPSEMGERDPRHPMGKETGEVACGIHQRGGKVGIGATGGDQVAHGKPALWLRAQVDGMPAVAGEGY